MTVEPRGESVDHGRERAPTDHAPQRGGDGAGGSGAVPLLDLDPGLGRGLSRQQRADARRDLIGRSRLLQPGDGDDGLFRSGLFGALVVEGGLARRVSTDRGRSLEILVQGDLLRPWQEDSGWVVESSIQPLVPTRIAVIHRFGIDSLCKYPPVVEALLERAFRRIRGLATQAAFDSRAGMDHRVLFSMWHLGDRCGERLDGRVTIPLPLTHQMIADLLGAQRTSVSAAISRLAAQGRLSRTAERGWTLHRGSDDLPSLR